MKYALITGANGGIGSAIRQIFLDNGWFVFGLDRAGEETATENYRFIPCDITSDESVQNALSSVSETTDELHVIINVAGVMAMGSLVEEPAALFQKMLDVNVAGTCRVNRAFFPLIEKGRGRYINFTSEYGLYATVPFHAFYTASKHAAESYNDGLRRELNYLGIPVIAIRPGAIATPMTDSTVPYFEKLLKTTTHYEKNYKKLKPLMENGTKNATPPEKLARLVYKAATVKRPKRAYKIHNDPLVGFLSILPESFIDFLFKKVLG